METHAESLIGSAAGAGSGEFHVYRALRRKEYARQKEMDDASKEVKVALLHDANSCLKISFIDGLCICISIMRN